MNAAYLMLTTAWLAGADPVPAAQAAPAVVASSNCGGCGSGCNSGCNTCCDDPCAKKPGLFARLCAKKGNDCGCESSCNTCDRAPKCREPRAPKCKAPREPKCRAPKNDCCDDPCAKKPGLFARLFAKKGNDCGCDSGCGCATASSGCGCGNGHGVISAPAGAPTGAPPEVAPQPKPSTPPAKTTALPMNGFVQPVVVTPY